MAEYPIIMKQKNDQGQYDTLYPQTLSSQIQGNIPASQIEGNIPSTQISGQFPANQVDGIYTAEQTLTQLIAQLFNLTSGNAVPNDVFNILSKAALLNTTEDGLVLPNGDTITLPGVQIETGSYVGNGLSGSNYKNNLNLSITPKFVIVYGFGPGGAGQETYSIGFLFPNEGLSFSEYRMSSMSPYYYSLGRLITTFGSNSVQWYCNDMFNIIPTGYSNVNYATSGDVLKYPQLNLNITYNYIAFV